MADEDKTIPLYTVITIDDEWIRGHLDRVVRGTVEETLNALLDAEVDLLDADALSGDDDREVADAGRRQ